MYEVCFQALRLNINTHPYIANSKSSLTCMKCSLTDSHSPTARLSVLNCFWVRGTGG